MPCFFYILDENKLNEMAAVRVKREKTHASRGDTMANSLSRFRVVYAAFASLVGSAFSPSMYFSFLQMMSLFAHMQTMNMHVVLLYLGFLCASHMVTNVVLAKETKRGEEKRESTQSFAFFFDARYATAGSSARVERFLFPFSCSPLVIFQPFEHVQKVNTSELSNTNQGIRTHSY